MRKEAMKFSVVAVPNEFAAAEWRRYLTKSDAARFGVVLGCLAAATVPLMIIVATVQDMIELRTATPLLLLTFESLPVLMTVIWILAWWRRARVQRRILDLTVSGCGPVPWLVGEIRPFQVLGVACLAPLLIVVLVIWALLQSQRAALVPLVDWLTALSSLRAVVFIWNLPLLWVSMLLLERRTVRALTILMLLLLPLHLVLFFILFRGFSAGLSEMAILLTEIVSMAGILGLGAMARSALPATLERFIQVQNERV
jgi:hypothetical protein